MMTTRKYHVHDHANNRWYVQLDPATIRRVRDLLGVDLETLTVEQFSHLVAAEHESEAQTADDLWPVRFASALLQPRTSKVQLTLSLTTLIRVVAAFARAMDERFPGRHFFWAVNYSTGADLIAAATQVSTSSLDSKA